MRLHNNTIYFQAYGPNTLSQAIMGTWTHLPPTRFTFQTAVVDQNRCFTVVLRCCFFSSCPTPLSAARLAALKIGFWPHKSYKSLVEPCLSAIISQPECWFWNSWTPIHFQNEFHDRSWTHLQKYNLKIIAFIFFHCLLSHMLEQSLSHF